GEKSSVFRHKFIGIKDPLKVDIKIRKLSSSSVISLSAGKEAEIYYSSGRSLPDRKSKKYSLPLKIPNEGVFRINAVAYDPVSGERGRVFSRAVAFDKSAPEIRFSLKDGLYKSSRELKISATKEAEIFYTTDGSEPDTGSKRYSAPLNFAAEKRYIIKAFAIDAAGIRSPDKILRFEIDKSPPELSFRTEKSGRGYKIYVSADEECRIYYVEGRGGPGKSPKLYKGYISASEGMIFTVSAVDEAGNRTRTFLVDELNKPRAEAVPEGGVFNRFISIKFRVWAGVSVYYRIMAGEDEPGFQKYDSAVVLPGSGLFKLEYYAEAPSGQRSEYKREQYLIDIAPPEVTVSSSFSPGSDSVEVSFSANENVSIYYTTDGTDPSSGNARVAANKFFSSSDTISAETREGALLRFFAEDNAGNRSKLFEYDISAPSATPSYIDGEYNEPLEVDFSTFQGNKIYYTLDGSLPTENSNLYVSPIRINSTSLLRYVTFDNKGYRGKEKRVEYKIDLPPKADFRTGVRKYFAKDTVTFDGSFSADEESGSDGLLFKWNFGDGDTTAWRTTPEASHFYNKPGIKKVVLSVRDKNLQTGSISRKVKIYASCRKGMVPMFSGEKSFCMDRYEWPNSKGRKPVTGVSWVEANVYCRDAGKRLCSISEWQSACAGEDSSAYSYGQVYVSEVCNTESGKAQESGSFEKCKTEDGIFDLSGNLWEWVGYSGGGYFVAGGGSDMGSRTKCSTLFPEKISVRDPGVGFRCCE
ncbi:MAG: chitobiase/beta-hexosaminidase C-terminal domain-containing protein, partial [Fibrobacterota bacterium]